MAQTTVKAEQIAINAISGTIIADNAITSVHIAQNAILTQHIDDGQVDTAQLAADAVTGAKLADSSVVTANIQDDQVTGDKLANNITIAGTLTSTGVLTANAGVGINTTKASGVALDIREDSTTTAVDVRNANSSGFGAYFAGGSSSSQYAFRAADKDNNALFSIMGDGNVGIGTSSPGAELHVSASTTTQVRCESTTNSSTSVFQLATNGSDWNLSAGGSSQATYPNSFYIYDAGADATRLVINASGNVGIGEISPQGALHVKSSDSGATADGGANDLVVENSSNAGISILSGASASGSIYFGDSGSAYDGYIQYDQTNRKFNFVTATSGGMTIDASNNVGIGTSSPSGKLHVAGDVVIGATGTDANRASVFYNTSTGQLILVVSDARLKKDFDYDIAGIETVKKLKPLRFSWKDSDKRQLGFLAQESIEADEHLAWNNVEEDTWGLDGWEGYAAVLTKAIQEQQTIIDNLKARIKTLEEA